MPPRRLPAVSAASHPMDYLVIVSGLAAFVLILSTLDILLRTCVSDDTIERWADRIFHV